MRRAMRLLLAVLMAAVGAVALWGTGASASDACTAGTNPSGQSVGYCAVWVPSGGVPVYAGTSTGSAVVDHLYTGGSANWFYCQVGGGTASASGYTSTNWARTVGDSHGAVGYVPAVYFAGVENYWAGLAACGGGSSPGGTRCTSGANSAGTTVFYCPVWVPSGGVPVYASASASATIVDRLYSGGDVNWFYCQTNGGTASAGGYTSSNWARTIGDAHGATGYVPAVYYTGAENYWAGMSACGTTPPPTADGGCTYGHNASGASVYYCPVWLPSNGVPVYGSTSTSSAIVGRLYVGGAANWFYCRLNGSTATVSGYSSSNWAKTLADNNATGYVPAVYFAGAQDYWPGLPTCGSGSTPPPPPPTSGGGSTSGSACGMSYSNLPALTLKFMQKMCLVTDPNSSLWQYRIYAWAGDHGEQPGPTRGLCDPSNGAPNDCNVVGFDCSGLTRYAYYLTTGVDALGQWGTSSQYPAALSLAPKAVIDGDANRAHPDGDVRDFESQLRPGDIIYYGYNANEHVAVYMGNGKQMNAYQSGTADAVTSVGTSGFWAAVRLW